MSGGNYDSYKTATPEDDGAIPQPCPVCTGDRDADPCTEECEEIILRAKTIREMRGACEAAEQAIKLSLQYISEGGADEPRTIAALSAVAAWSKYARDLSTILSLQADDMRMADTQPAPALTEAAE